MGAARIAFAVLLALVAGCLESSVTTCEDGTLCPAGSVCAPQGCVLEEQLEACAGLAEGAPCMYSGVPEGRCVDGACESFACGNGVEDAGEACDDGNNTSGDGCSGDCRKDEVCGDGEIDASELGVGEQCDDGNTNPADECGGCMDVAWDDEVLIGGDTSGTSVALANPSSVAVDVNGNVYFVDANNNVVRRVDVVAGVITTVAGSGALGDEGDGGPATSAQLGSPFGVAVDGLGNVYISQPLEQRIRRVDHATGVITTIAGTGTQGPAVDGIAATSARLRGPGGVAVDGLGNLYFADSGNHRIRRVDAESGLISTVVGATQGNADGAATAVARLSYPSGVALDADETLYIVDSNNHRIRRLDAGVVTTVAGSGPGPGIEYGDFEGDGFAATSARLASPEGAAIDAAGNLYIADTANHCIRKVDAVSGDITTIAGTGEVFGFSDLLFYTPRGVAVGPSGTLYITDSDNGRVRSVDGGVIATVAGTGGVDFGDGRAATSVFLDDNSGVVVDDAGVVTFSNGCRVHRVDPATGVMTTVAGTETCGPSGDGGLATEAQLSAPRGLAVDGAGNLYIADSYNHCVRRIDAGTGIITRFAGICDQLSGPQGDGGPATAARLLYPRGVAVDGSGNVFIADTGHSVIRRVDAITGLITRVAGDGSNGSGVCLDGPALSTQMFNPSDVAVDGAGNLFIADPDKGCVRKLDASTGQIATVPLPVSWPLAVHVDGSGNLLIGDAERVWRVDGATGVVSTVAGGAGANFDGDGGAATDAAIYYAQGVAMDSGGNVYVATQDGHVRRIDAATGVIKTIAGAVDPPSMGPLDQARLDDPRALVLAPGVSFLAGGTSGTVQAVRDGWLGVVAGRYLQDLATPDLARFGSADFGAVGGVAYDATDGVIYLTETSANRVHAVTITDPTDEDVWPIAVLAGDGSAGFADGPAATARFRAPTGLYVDEAARILYVADTGNHVIRAIDLDTASVSTFAGTPQVLGFFGDVGPPDEALLYAPEALTKCSNGDVFVADTGNHRVRRIAGGAITTVLGDGVAASSGQGFPARDFPVDAPRGLACDAVGNLYVTSSTTVRQVFANDQGVVDGNRDVRTIFGEPPRTDFPDVVTFCLTGLAIVDDTTVHVTDACTGMLIELTRGAP